MAASDEFTNTYAISENCLIALENIIRQTLVKKVSESTKAAKFFWIHKKHRNKYDIFLDFKSFCSSALLTAMELEKIIGELKLNSDISALIKECEVVNFDLRLLGVKLERAKVISKVLNNINNLRSKYGRPVAVTNQNIFMHAFTSDNNLQLFTITDLRSCLLTNLIKQIFIFSGYAVESNFINSKPGVYLELNNCCDLTCNDKQIKLKKYFYELSNVGLQFMDAIVKFEHTLLDHTSVNVNLFVFVSSENLWFKSHSSIKRWEEITNISPIPSSMYVKHGVVNLIDEDNILIEDLYGKILEETKKSSLDKYGDMTDDEANYIFHRLADFSLKMAFFTRLTSHKITNMKMEGAIRDAAFIMYNYARICVLLKNFKKKIQQRTNCATLLPPVAKVDLSLLNKEEEWDLVLLCAKYPDVINEILKDLLFSSVLSSHKLTNYLVELSHSLSVYYNRINILADLRVHVQATLFARLHLILCVKIILENCFFLFDIKPIKKM